jgi:threonine/homoserine/homoserine lactone efflux protein
MPDLVHWSTFLTATIVLLVIPGPSVIYVITRSIEHDYRGAVLSSLGLALGDLLQVFCTVAGLSALLASSSWLFAIVKYVGAAYLIVLGLHRLLSNNPTSRTHSVIAELPPKPMSSRSLIAQAFFALNPKTAIFFLALFPQFLAENAGPVWLQIIVFGFVFVVLGFVTNSAYGCLGGSLRSIARHGSHFQTATRYVSSAVLIGMGIAAALARSA